VCHNDFRANSAIQMFHLSNALVDLGHEVTTLIPAGTDTVLNCGSPSFRVLEFSDVVSGVPLLASGAPPDLVHSWTPREAIRKLTQNLVERFGCPYFVHLEDNEDFVTSVLTGLPLEQLLVLPDSIIDPRIGGTWSHPRRMRAFLAGAAGVSVLIDRLSEFVPDHVPHVTIWPSCNEKAFYPQDADEDLHFLLGIAKGEFVLTYNGNLHAANLTEMRALYLAVGLLNRVGHRVRLIRLGTDFADAFGEARSQVEPFIIQLGHRPHNEQSRYLALADALVQPGRPDKFNDYRFPSKLPEFLRMGKPVVLPKTNVGLAMTDEENCLLLTEGTAVELADKIERLIVNQNLRERLAAGALAFSREHLSWAKAAKALSEFYDDALLTHSRKQAFTRLTPAPAPDAQLLAAARRYADFKPTPLSYGTVEDYVDSLEALSDLATINRDLKDVQRTWVLKAILGCIPSRSKLLEIGGGDPWVADRLARLGYELCIVDPYDGRDNGPNNFHDLQRSFPHIRFIRSLFPPKEIDILGKNDCIYSISVLEHVDDDALRAVFDGIRTYSTDNAMTIHAVDHVFLGLGQEDHYRKIVLIARELGLEQIDIDALLVQLNRDPDAYFLSADAHNMWRGGTPYKLFPMRRCPSIQFCVPVRNMIRAAQSPGVRAMA
jgi:glycosyltransferase involved in cell wall biosynthesis